jgi:hypothetical protein
MTESTPSSSASASGPASGAQSVIMIIAWLWVLIPFLWGVWELLIKVVPLFSAG